VRIAFNNASGVGERMTTIEKNPSPPWGSKGSLNRTGEKLRLGHELNDEELYILESWRGAHSYVLNTFKPLLWSRIRGNNIVLAQRLKRRATIIDKLHREPHMELARMDDIAGCRLIFEDIAKLEEFRRKFHKSKFNHKLKHERDVDKYNYIERPKASGYRGVHEIYIYNVNSEGGRPLNGLYVEMQFRTLCQHAWATAVEVVSRVTENQPKFNRGDERHKEFFRLASEIIARTVEERKSCCHELNNKNLVIKFKDLDSQINVLRFLKNLPIVEQASRVKNNVILHVNAEGKLTVHKFANVKTATDSYFELEKSNPNDDIVLVRAKTFDAIRSAYRNYFQNTTEFLKYIDDGLKSLEK
jgi:putative GTP pyrophosphokinase